MISPDDGMQILVGQLRELITSARSQALRAVDVIQVRTCWEIGRHIVEFEQGGAARADYGARLISNLAVALKGSLAKDSMGQICAICGCFTKPFRYVTRCVTH